MFVPSSRRSSLPVFPARLSKPPLSFRRDIFLRMFSLLTAPAGARRCSRHAHKHLFLPQHTPLRPSESLAFLEREPTPPVLLRRFYFGEFCIVSHETSAFSMFSTCLILLCFCPILIAFWRDLERKTRFFACLPLSRPIFDLCPRAAAVTQTAASRGNTRPATNRRATPEDERNTRGVGEGMGSSLRATARHKNKRRTTTSDSNARRG